MDELSFDDERPRSFRRSGEPDMATVVGIVCALGLVFLAIVLGGDLSSFVNLSSILIVFGGTAGATLVTFSFDDIRRAGAVLRQAVFEDRYETELRVRRMSEIARRARNDGLLALEQVAYSEPDEFLRKGLQLVADAVPAAEIEHTLTLELEQGAERHRRGALIFQTMGAVAPAMGLLGTLIGLVQMLHNLNDPSKIGPGMATALLTTFYGALVAYLVFLPIAAKLRNRSTDETRVKQLTIEGLVAIAREMNPRLVEQHLQVFLPPESRFGLVD